MKKLYIICVFVVVSILMVFAGDTIKILRVYHNGIDTAILLVNIDSINHVKNNFTSIIEAVDSTYNIPINEIDSVAITEADLEEYNQYTEAIRQYIVDQEDLPTGQYQNKLLEWLNNCDFVSKAILSDLKDEIKIEFINGMEFCINFVDLSQYSDDGTENSEEVRETRSDNQTIALQRYFNITSLPQEEIINPNILYIQGRSMPRISTESKMSNAASEWAELNNIYKSSPIAGELKLYSKTFDVFNEDFSKYGLIIISQTHGDGKRSGAFQIEDTRKYWEALLNKGKKGINIYTNGQKVCVPKKDEPYIYWVYANYFGSKISRNLVYGIHCYSYDLYKKGYDPSKGSNATFFGYDTSTNYCYGSNTPAKDSLIIRMNRFFNGYTYKNALWLKPYYTHTNAKGEKDTHIPMINKPNSKQRCFSIYTKTISEGKGISGKINGYKNLKGKNDGLKYLLYVHEGNDVFTPQDEGVKKISNVVNIVDSEGTFEISSDVVNDYPDHAFIVGFEYAGKVYYGEMKTKEINLCPDSNHPHLIDLGLPNGTKWACCNLGANAPEESGDYYAWGETEVHKDGLYWWYNYKYKDPSMKLGDCLFLGDNISGTEYDAAYEQLRGKMPTTADIVELDENCDETKYIINGIEGTLFTGKNGGRLFIPWSGSIQTQSFNNTPHYWLAEESDYYNHSHAYSFSPADRWVYTQYSIPKYYGCPIRPIKY